MTWTQSYLQRHIPDSPRLDAEVLLAHVLQVSRVYLYTHYEQPLDGAEAAAYGQLVRRRAAHEPVAYLTGQREFYGLPLQVGREVLIPRPETEHLVEAALQWCAAHPGAPPRIWDVGTGSGAIAVALATQLPAAQVVASDVSEAALQVAQRNCERHGVASRVLLRQGDLAAALEPAACFDLIVANLPYVPQAAVLPRSVAQYEPPTALFGGAAGLDLLRRLCGCAADLLQRPGGLIVELQAPQHQEVLTLLRQQGGWSALRVGNDLQNQPRLVQAEVSQAATVDGGGAASPTP